MSDDVWVYVSGTGDTSLHPTRHDAEEAARDDPDAWIERTTPWEATGAQPGDETAPQVDPDAPTRQAGAGRVWMAPPILTVHGTGFYNPWHEDN